MKNRIIRIIIILIVLFNIITIYNNQTYATNQTYKMIESTKIAEEEDYSLPSMDSVFEDAEGFVQKGESQTYIDKNKSKPISDFIYNALLAIGLIVTVVWGIAIGIQFMIASAEEKAKVKESLLPYVIGCIVIFGAFGIWKLAITIVGSL